VEWYTELIDEMSELNHELRLSDPYGLVLEWRWVSQVPSRHTGRLSSNNIYCIDKFTKMCFLGSYVYSYYALFSSRV